MLHELFFLPIFIQLQQFRRSLHIPLLIERCIPTTDLHMPQMYLRMVFEPRTYYHHRIVICLPIVLLHFCELSFLPFQSLKVSSRSRLRNSIVPMHLYKSHKLFNEIGDFPSLRDVCVEAHNLNRAVILSLDIDDVGKHLFGEYEHSGWFPLPINNQPLL
jgi:hypothetical protein